MRSIGIQKRAAKSVHSWMKEHDTNLEIRNLVSGNFFIGSIRLRPGQRDA